VPAAAANATTDINHLRKHRCDRCQHGCSSLVALHTAQKDCSDQSSSMTQPMAVRRAAVLARPSPSLPSAVKPRRSRCYGLYLCCVGVDPAASSPPPGPHAPRWVVPDANDNGP
jgi:hypothetical protein